ncbi:dynein light chain roadblock-type 2-like [Lepeophtheirus salmonis]|uniref:dynein light chain roadblock-type 2-like n=1 Tax=Lepeophtheirus salmonis TaxID=72036 RepID=UPI003AF3D471
MPQRNQATDLEEIIHRIQDHTGVTGLIVVNRDGVAVRTTMDMATTNQHCAVLSRLSDQARSAVRDLDPNNDVTFLRLRSKKNEILLAPDKDFTLVVIQDPRKE